MTYPFRFTLLKLSFLEERAENIQRQRELDTLSTLTSPFISPSYIAYTMLKKSGIPNNKDYHPSRPEHLQIHHRL